MNEALRDALRRAPGGGKRGGRVCVWGSRCAVADPSSHRRRHLEDATPPSRAPSHRAQPQGLWQQHRREKWCALWNGFPCRECRAGEEVPLCRLLALDHAVARARLGFRNPRRGRRGTEIQIRAEASHVAAARAQVEAQHWVHHEQGTSRVRFVLRFTMVAYQSEADFQLKSIRR